eukprot:674929-Rhodomonas_salina.1
MDCRVLLVILVGEQSEARELLNEQARVAHRDGPRADWRADRREGRLLCHALGLFIVRQRRWRGRDAEVGLGGQDAVDRVCLVLIRIGEHDGPRRLFPRHRSLLLADLPARQQPAGPLLHLHRRVVVNSRVHRPQLDEPPIQLDLRNAQVVSATRVRAPLDQTEVPEAMQAHVHPIVNVHVECRDLPWPLDRQIVHVHPELRPHLLVVRALQLPVPERVCGRPEAVLNRVGGWDQPTALAEVKHDPGVRCVASETLVHVFPDGLTQSLDRTDSKFLSVGRQNADAIHAFAEDGILERSRPVAGANHLNRPYVPVAVRRRQQLRGVLEDHFFRPMRVRSCPHGVHATRQPADIFGKVLDDHWQDRRTQFGPGEESNGVISQFLRLDPKSPPRLRFRGTEVHSQRKVRSEREAHVDWVHEDDLLQRRDRRGGNPADGHGRFEGQAVNDVE